MTSYTKSNLITFIYFHWCHTKCIILFERHTHSPIYICGTLLAWLISEKVMLSITLCWRNRTIIIPVIKFSSCSPHSIALPAWIRHDIIIAKYLCQQLNTRLNTHRPVPSYSNTYFILFIIFCMLFIDQHKFWANINLINYSTHNKPLDVALWFGFDLGQSRT